MCVCVCVCVCVCFNGTITSDGYHRELFERNEDNRPPAGKAEIPQIKKKSNWKQYQHQRQQQHQQQHQQQQKQQQQSCGIEYNGIIWSCFLPVIRFIGPSSTSIAVKAAPIELRQSNRWMISTTTTTTKLINDPGEDNPVTRQRQ